MARVRSTRGSRPTAARNTAARRPGLPGCRHDAKRPADVLRSSSLQALPVVPIDLTSTTNHPVEPSFAVARVTRRPAGHPAVYRGSDPPAVRGSQSRSRERLALTELRRVARHRAEALEGL
jgi:hypothetical protein